MNGGVIVVAGVVGLFALFETVLPWTFAGLRKWLRRTAKVAEKNAEAVIPPPVADEKPPDDDLTIDGAFNPPVEPPTPPADEQPLADERSAADERPLADERLAADDGQTAARLWKEARGMAHNFTPDWELDRDYLAKIYGAAKLGHLEAMAKLGEYALRRGAVVEAYYWTALAELHGAFGLGEELLMIGSLWMSEGYPTEYENVYDEFTEMQGSFARALLRIRCAVDTPIAEARMRELAEQGCVEAQLFLKE